jgi:pilus assembly protein Flp/PilA
MKCIQQKFEKVAKRFIQEEDGVTAIEYGLIAAATAVVIIVALGNIKTGLSGIFTSIATAI